MVPETKYVVIEYTLVGGNYSVNVGVNSDAVKAAVLQRIVLGEEYYSGIKDTVEGGLCREASRKFTEGLQQLLWPGGVLDKGRGNIPTSPTSCCYSGGKVTAHFVLPTGTITETELEGIVNRVTGSEKELYADVTRDLEGGISRKQLTEARTYAKAAKLEDMESALEIAEEYAKRAGSDISKQRADIKKIGNAAMIPIALYKARESVKGGELSLIDGFISIAQFYAQQAGQDVSKEVEEIRELIKK